ncbi:hypothetical protein [Sphingomonas sp. SORGH_AS_0438]|uniref:hypothetical protein n=1 Tax=Sphingomonas sp. SORGH_AS_0438 TaxID=3041756 RepID=UPI00285ECC76|nr:hypothetical protein [Sphingomonas sp. SORGH_AS_0438]MDR6125426.1 hypothetical protein [Sphingomonas sp. SORGH_AS_0438]
MKKIIAATAAFGAFASAGSAQAADFVFNTVNSGKVTGSGYGNAFTYSGSDGSRSITMKATGWSRGFDGALHGRRDRVFRLGRSRHLPAG